MKAIESPQVGTAASNASVLRTELLRLLHELIEIDAIFSEVVPIIYSRLPRGERWEVSEELEAFNGRIDHSIEKMETGVIARAWKDRDEMPGMVQSIRRAGRAARELAEKLEAQEFAGFENFISALWMLARGHKAVAAKGNHYVAVLMDDSETGWQPRQPHGEAGPVTLDAQAIAGLLATYG